MRFAGVVVAAAVLLSACSGSTALDSADAGRTVAYEPGVPNFDMEAVVRVAEDSSVVDILYSLPLSSLVFEQAGESFEAEYEIVVQLTDREGRRLVVEESRSETIAVASFDSTVSHNLHANRLTLGPSPGEYVADVTLTDLSSESAVRRRQAVTIPARGDADPFIGRPLIEGIRDGPSFEPIVSMHIPSTMDSLRASVHLFNLSDEVGLDITMRLLQFDTDSTIASPPYWLVPTRASLEHRGIDYDTADTVQVTRRPLQSVDESAVVVFSLPALPKGVYRLTITALQASGERLLKRERLLSVKSTSFPSVSALDELVDALAYIAYDDEIAAIREGGSVMERKRRFDVFWGSLVPNRNLAASLIRLYYERIEEANLFFTGYKEGWKTDRGMIYTIFGPPIYVEDRVNVEIWHYSYGDRDPAHTFVFEKSARQIDDDPFETYILQRRPYYQHEWSRAVDRWRDGEVL